MMRRPAVGALLVVVGCVLVLSFFEMDVIMATFTGTTSANPTYYTEHHLALAAEIEPHLNKYIAFSLYLTKDYTDKNVFRYLDNFLHNLEQLPYFLPGWKLRVYASKELPEYFLHLLKTWDEWWPHPTTLPKLQLEVVIMEHSDIPHIGNLWRFLIIDDKAVDLFIVRDADAIMTPRESRAIEHWVKSGVGLFAVNDHPQNLMNWLIAGSWGARRELFPSTFVVANELTKFKSSETLFNTDQQWLDGVVLQFVLRRNTSDCMFFRFNLPNSFYGEQLPCTPFPTPRISTDHGGMQFNRAQLDGFWVAHNSCRINQNFIYG